MKRVRRADTAPEIAVRGLLHKLGYRFRLHRKDLPGTPDIVFPSRKKVIFVHGCFWHGHQNCPKATTPKTRRNFWLEKFSKNQERDAKKVEKLRDMGWESCVVWECENTSPVELEKKLKSFLGSQGPAEDVMGERNQKSLFLTLLTL